MNEEQLKHYHEFCNDLWRFFRKYSKKGITDDLVWQAVHDADALKSKHAGCLGHRMLVDDIIRQLQNIAEHLNPVQDPRQRLRNFFDRAGSEPAGQPLWDTVGTWMDWFTGIYPEHADDVIDKLRGLLAKHGHHIGFDELKDYAKAGWVLVVRPKEGDHQ